MSLTTRIMEERTGTETIREYYWKENTKIDINSDYSFLRDNGYNVGASILSLLHAYTYKEIKEDLELNPL